MRTLTQLESAIEVLLNASTRIGGHKEAAAARLKRVVQLMPNDRLAGELLRMVQGPPQQPAAADFGLAPTPAPDATLAPTPDPIDKSLLPGTWHASRPDGSKFVLALTEGGTFDWKFILPNKKGEDFGGTYTVNGPVLILKRQPELNRQDSGALAGTVTFRNDEHFLFKLVGSPPDDQGLEFKR